MTLAVEFRNISKSYHKSNVLRGIDLSIELGDFTVIYGLPASGKSVLMRLLMGLEKPTEGQIRLRGGDAAKISPGDRNIGYVPQSFALYPHYNVFQNIAYPLKMQHMPLAQIEPNVIEAARLLNIENLLEKRPDQISGGQKQRVAIARGIVKKTDIYVLDDPLAGLDFKLREQLVDDLKRLHANFGMTFIYTTSDPIESLSLAKHIAVLDGGRMVEYDKPEKLYMAPSRLKSLELLGFPKANVLKATWFYKFDRPWCRSDLFEFPLRWDNPDSMLQQTGDAYIGFRPENVWLMTNENDGTMLPLDCKVALREDLGGEEIVYLETKQGILTTVVRHEGYESVANSTRAYINPANLFVFNEQDGERIGKGVISSV
jgi:ABC-type sugar transport system ATPase subunit